MNSNVIWRYFFYFSAWAIECGCLCMMGGGLCFQASPGVWRCWNLLYCMYCAAPSITTRLHNHLTKTFREAPPLFSSWQVHSWNARGKDLTKLMYDMLAARCMFVLTYRNKPQVRCNTFYPSSVLRWRKMKMKLLRAAKWAGKLS